MRELRGRLPAETVAAWPKVVRVLPGAAYLAGGTALVIHLDHRISRDLDVFVPHPFDTDRLLRDLEQQGAVTVTRHTRDTLNGVLDGTRVQFLEATDHARLDPPQVVAGMPVAGLRELMADKLKAVGDRGELRDYFDLMAIELATPHRCEHGLRYYRERYGVGPEDVTLTHIVRGLAHFGDVADDPALPATRAEIEAYWRRRQPALLEALGSTSLTHGQPPPSSSGTGDGGPPPRPSGRCGARTVRGAACTNPKGCCPHHDP